MTADGTVGKDGVGPALCPVVIAGPTASGKSAVAVALAERLGGCVVNADALQVYSCWRVLTARPGEAECARAPHALYGHVGCEVRYSVGTWLRGVAEELADLRTRGLRPIIVGGTGLYLGALFEGLSPIPEIAAPVRAAANRRLAEHGIEALLHDLARLDPVSLDRLDRSNPRRVQRAWEVATATGRGLSEWQRAKSEPLLQAGRAVRIVIETEKSFLNKLITIRFHEMIERGAVEECAAFIAAHHDRSLPAARALGFAEIAGFLEGQWSRQAAIERAVMATRQYAKRQRTWIRSRMARWDWVNPMETDVVEAVATRLGPEVQRR